MNNPFLSAIIAEPDDDAHRLVCADWLDENGDPDRAEFIRTQCALARLPEDDPRRAELEAREIQLLARHAPEWAAPWPAFQNWEWAGGDPVRAIFRRGFVESLNPFGEWNENLQSEQALGRMSAGHPVREVFFDGNPEPLARWTGLSRVESLSLWDANLGQAPTSSEQLTDFLRSADLRRLRKLFLGRQTFSGDPALLSLPVLAQLESLNDPSVYPNDGGFLRALTEGHFPNLRDLHTTTSGVQACREAVGQLIHSELWGRLTDFSLAGSYPFPWAEALARSSLRRLRRITPERAELSALTDALVACTGEPSLEEVHLQPTVFSPADLVRAFLAPALARLRRFSVVHTPLTAEHLTRLASCPALGHIQRLKVWVSSANAGLALETFCASPHLGAMTRLTLVEYIPARTPTAAVKALAANPACRRLRFLSLGGLAEETLAALATGEPFPDLHTISFGLCERSLSPKALEAFLDSPNFPRLCAVRLSVRSEVAESLGQVLRRCDRIAWAGGEMGDGGDGVRVALKPDNVYLPNHLDDFAD